jgi:hypothetical protein
MTSTLVSIWVGEPLGSSVKCVEYYGAGSVCVETEAGTVWLQFGSHRAALIFADELFSALEED